APALVFRALLDRELEADDSRVHEHALVVTRELARRAHPTSVGNDRVERIMGRVRARQHDAQLDESIVDAHSHLARKLPVSVPCQRWPPSKTSCTTASGGAPTCA